MIASRSVTLFFVGTGGESALVVQANSTAMFQRKEELAWTKAAAEIAAAVARRKFSFSW